jgi:plastocyanin
MLIIECIKGFRLDGGSLPIMKGEIFKLSEESGIGEMVFEASATSLNPGMEIEFTNDQLCNNFQLIVGR